MLTEARYGFIEHGHLAGTRAFIGCISSSRSQGLVPVKHFIADAKRSILPVLLYLRDRRPLASEIAGDIAEELRAIGKPVAACVRPGTILPLDWLAYASILRVTAGDVPTVGEVTSDCRLASISVHCWPGSGVLYRLAAEVEAPFGRFLFVTGDDIGQAKVWLQGDPDSRWRIHPSHPLNSLEPAEIAEMTNGTRFSS